MDCASLEVRGATRARVDGRELVYFGGCDYLGLAHEPAVVAALCETARREGLSPGASRATSGGRREHELLEQELAERTGFEAALTLGEGALANLALAEALAGRARRALVDEAAHASGLTGLRAAGFEVERYERGDAAELRRRVGAGCVVWTDGVYPTRGALAPVGELVAALPERGAWLVVDDAHGFGALGERGLGACERLDPRDLRVAVTLTFSKALGCYGGAVLSNRALIEELRARSATFVGTTPMPAALASAARVALGLALDDPTRRARLRANGARLFEHLRAQGRAAGPPPPLPVFLLRAGSRARGEAWSALLKAAGFLVPLTDYPGDAGVGLRLVVNAMHEPAEIDALAEALARLR